MKHRLSLEEKLAAIKMVEDGQSARSVSDKLHLGHHLLYEWISVYKEKGVDGLKTDNKRKSKHLSHEEKCKIIREYQENDLPLYQVCARHGISLSALTNWLTVVEKGGFESLACPKNKRCKSGMTRKKRQPKGDLEKEGGNRGQAPVPVLKISKLRKESRGQELSNFHTLTIHQ